MFRSVGPCPPGVVPVPEPIEGTAFFPGGLGLWLEQYDSRPPFPKDIMVVGQDFNTRATSDRARIAGSEVGSSSTWRNMKKVFPTLGVPLKDCFFTNVYMGLRTIGPETGRFPGAKDREYVARCATFFKRQLEVAQPKIIVTLGLEPLRFLGDRVFGFRHPGAISRCDQIYAPMRAPHGQVAIVPLTHPSLYFVNVGRRRFADHVGIEAERAMVRAAAALVTKEET
jgi:uracil-DNA glycosylase family 4